MTTAFRPPSRCPRVRRVAAALVLVLGTPLLFRVVDLDVAQAATIVYATDFESGAGPEWSPAQTEETPGTAQHPADGFLGRFGNGGTTLSLTNLPSHSDVTVSFSLYVIRSWDGNSEEWGPDTWDMSVAGGPTVLHTTFSNLDTGPCVGHGFNQAYPDSYPGGDHPPLTGADEVDTLGYPALCEANDAVYDLVVTFNHSGDSLQLTFTGSHLQELSDESWGIDDFSVSVNDASPGTTAVTTTTTSEPTTTTTTVCKPGHGYGDKNHCHSGPRGRS